VEGTVSLREVPRSEETERIELVTAEGGLREVKGGSGGIAKSLILEYWRK